jgi:hypothetical protein
MADRESITVYVRLGPNDDENQRLLSFRRPSDIPTSELLQLGFAIDGNQVVSCVAWMEDEEGFTGPIQPGVEVTLIDALRQEERALAAWLDGHGYDVEFA